MAAVEKSFSQSFCRRAIVLIFVSVGTNTRPFDRLVRAVDEAAPHFEEELIVQLGYSSYCPAHVQWIEFCNPEELDDYVKACRLLICHAGFGIIGSGIRLQKPMILVPRELQLGEAVNPQYELAEYLASQEENIHVIRDLTRLRDTIEVALQLKKTPIYHYKTDIPSCIFSFVVQY